MVRSRGGWIKRLVGSREWWGLGVVGFKGLWVKGWYGSRVLGLVGVSRGGGGLRVVRVKG